MTTSTPSAIDVRTIVPYERHGLIFARLTALAPGQALQLINDHDPVPLRHQLDQGWPGQFVFEYLKAGPELWQVEICRKDVGTKAVSDSCCSGGSCGG